jgi:hypothetical protein
MARICAVIIQNYFILLSPKINKYNYYWNNETNGVRGPVTAVYHVLCQLGKVVSFVFGVCKYTAVISGFHAFQMGVYGDFTCKLDLILTMM